MAEIGVRNAVITDARFDTERGLSAWIYLDYGGTGQGFGGWLLYGPKGWRAHGDAGNYAGHFIWRVLEIAGVDDWSKLKGKTVRARGSWDKVEAIGHPVKDDWFDPAVEFAQLKEAARG